jgi:hypothetical protein
MTVLFKSSGTLSTVTISLVETKRVAIADMGGG